MAQKNRTDLKAYSRGLIVEAQTSEEISPEDHNLVNDEMIDSLLNALDDLATADDFITLLSTAKKYLNPYIASLYFLRKSDKATQLEVIAGLNNSKYITPYGLTAALVGNYGIRDYNPDSLYAEGAGCFYDDGGGFRLYRCTNPDGTAGTFAPADWEAIGGAGDVLPNTWTTLTPASDTIYLDCTDKNFPRFKSTLGTSDLTILIDYPEAILEGVLELHTTGATSGALLLDSFYAWIYNGGIISDYQLPDGTDKYYQFKFKYNAGIMYLEVTDGAGTGGGSFTETSQAQVEAAFDNTAIGTPTILETDKGVTPNKLWYFGQKVKTYIATQLVGLWDDRGSYDASVNAYPSGGGSGTAGAILKGDIWTISVAGTLPTGVVVEVGDTVRALVDTPGSTQANWAVLQNNIGYVAENSANKTDTVSGNEASTSLYLCVKGFVDGIKTWLIGALNTVTSVLDADFLVVGINSDGSTKKITHLNYWTNYIKAKTDANYLAIKTEQVIFLPENAYLASSNSALAGFSWLTNSFALAFPSTAGSYARFKRFLPETYNGYIINVTIYYCCETATSGNVKWNVAFDNRGTGVDASSESYATVKSVTSTVPAVAKQKKSEEISFTSSEIDGLVAGTPFMLRIYRDTTVGSNAAGNVLITEIKLTFS